ncbi:unnamed protein product [Musa acuminata subsp. malaccensis]|uniref:(wild Malaysian banana) hypothetical protein n=1 Tax=Musa acuminata subsp. malaccensis TaxID=214687 RepID=A0A804JUU6_MUSAM|nr:unnamed protein product [Musa acuminata subsp. malaccensis]
MPWNPIYSTATAYLVLPIKLALYTFSFSYHTRLDHELMMPSYTACQSLRAPTSVAVVELCLTVSSRL